MVGVEERAFTVLLAVPVTPQAHFVANKCHTNRRALPRSTRRSYEDRTCLRTYSETVRRFLRGSRPREPTADPHLGFLKSCVTEKSPKMNILSRYNPKYVCTKPMQNYLYHVKL